jgi:hypothetical protein
MSYLVRCIIMFDCNTCMPVLVYWILTQYNGKYQLKTVKLLLIQNKNCRSNAKTEIQKCKRTHRKSDKAGDIITVNFYSPDNRSNSLTTEVIKSGRIYATHVAHMGKKTNVSFFVGKPEQTTWKNTRWRSIILKTVFKGKGWGHLDWINLIQTRDHYSTLMNPVMTFWITWKKRAWLCKPPLASISFWRNTVHAGS